MTASHCAITLISATPDGGLEAKSSMPKLFCQHETVPPDRAVVKAMRRVESVIASGGGGGVRLICRIAAWVGTLTSNFVD